MKKIHIYTLLVIFVISIAAFYIFKDNSKTFTIDNIKYGVTVNGTPQDSFPAKGPYSVGVSCTNADAKWNYQDWFAELSNVTGAVSCSLEFVSTTKVTLNNYLINLLGGATSVSSTSNNDGSIFARVNVTLDSTINGTTASANNYRFRGKDPNNYIMFNGELWRIIGIFDQYTHGISGAKLVKIIRKDHIGPYIMDNAAAAESTSSKWGKNNFTNTDLYKVLNTAYYGHTNGNGQSYCYSAYGNDEEDARPGRCNFTKIGIQSTYQSMIESGVSWRLGGTDSAAIKVAKIFQYERGTVKYSSNYATSGDAGVTMRIGLMYPSDYAYAGLSSCTANMSERNSASCVQTNWLKSSYPEWTIMHLSSKSYGNYYIETNGALSDPTSTSTVGYDMRGWDGKFIRPTLYLKSNVYYLSGTGTQTDPYIIGI